MPACILSDIYIPIPLLFLYDLLGRTFNNILTHPELRVASLGFGMVILISWYFLVKSKGNSNNLDLIAVIFLAPPIFINSFIYLRPEKFLLFFLVFSIYLNLYDNKRLITALLYGLSFGIVIVNHPKSYYFFLIYFFIFYKCINKKNIYSIVGNIAIVLTVLLASLQNYFLTLDAYICNPVPFISSIVSNYALNPLLLIQDPAGFFYKIYSFNDLSHTYRAISQVFIKSNYDIKYLPDIIISKYLIIIINLPIVYVLLKIYYNLLSSSLKNSKDLFLFIYLFTISIVYLFSGNKGAYDIAFTVTSLLIIIPFSIHVEIKIPKIALYYLGILFSVSYCYIVFNLLSGWVGPGVQLIKKINYNEINYRLDKYLENYHNILYEDNTAFMFNNFNEKYPVTYFIHLASGEANLVRRNLKGKTYLFAGRCTYLNAMQAQQPDLIITTLDKFVVDGISEFYGSKDSSDYVCISQVN